MPKVDQFAIALALITTSLAALLNIHSLAYGALFLGFYLVCNPYIQDYFWGEYRPTLSEINKLSAEGYKQNLNPKFDRWVKHISKPHPIKWGLLVPFFLVLIVVGVAGLFSNYTQKPSAQWVLESYSADKGYTFRKDGVTYLTHCTGFTSAELIQSLPHGAIVSPLRNSSQEESSCSVVLAYLHKAVPMKQGEPFAKTVLVYPQATDGSFKNGVFEFLITEAE